MLDPATLQSLPLSLFPERSPGGDCRALSQEQGCAWIPELCGVELQTQPLGNVLGEY